MTTHDQSEPVRTTRRAVLQRGAAVTASVWAVPVMTSVTSPAQAAGSPMPPGGQEVCRTQTFLVDRDDAALTYTPAVEHSFLVDLGVSFAEVTSILVRLYESPTDQLEEGEFGSVRFRKEDQPNVSIGVGFQGSQSDPVTIAFAPRGGHAPEQTYGIILQDGRAELIVAQEDQPGGQFTLLRVEIEVCGTVAGS